MYNVYNEKSYKLIFQILKTYSYRKCILNFQIFELIIKGFMYKTKTGNIYIIIFFNLLKFYSF